MMKRVILCIVALMVAGCEYRITPAPGTSTHVPTLTATLTPFPTNTAAPTLDPTPTAEDWIDEPRNPGAYLDGEPITDVMSSAGNPPVTVQHPPAWDLFGIAPVRWPAVYKRGEGLPSQYEYNVSYLSGTYGLGQFERACERCLVVMRAHFSLHTTTWGPGVISFSADLWPTSGHSGACAPLKLPGQSPPAPVDANEWSATWLITSGTSDWYGRFTFTIPWPIFGDDSVLWIHSIEVREVGPDYGDAAAVVACQ